jgi:hypothetical protein
MTSDEPACRQARLRITDNEKMLNKIIKITLIIYMTIVVIGMADAMEKSVLHGSVSNVKGDAVRGAEIYLYDSPDTRRPADFISSETDAEGRFSVALPRGRYWAVARVSQGEQYGLLMPENKHSGEPVVVDIERSGSFEQSFIVMNLIESAQMMQKKREDYFIVKGRIVDKNGVPVGNMYVFANRGIYMREFPDYISAWSNDKGKYSLHMPEGRYYVGYAAEFPPVMQNKMLVEIEVQNDREGFDVIADFIQEDVQKGQQNEKDSLINPEVE